MNLIVAADLHLKDKTITPERFSALENILKQAKTDSINTVIFSGDLFDSTLQNYSDFEAVCNQHSAMQIHIIPGNHDPDISKRQISSANVTIYTEPTLVNIDSEGPPFLFLPYEKNKSMGDRIAEFSNKLTPNKWVLVGHGDYMDGLRDVNPYEDGLYMPFTRKDLTNFHPHKVFLGHIHAPMDKEPVYYTGSPCGLDISETGPRRFLVYDTHTGVVESHRINSDVIFYDETLTVFPMEDESIYIREKAKTIIQRWKLEPAEYGRVRLRLKINGYSTDKTKALNTIKDCFEPFSFYKNEEPNNTELNISNDPDRVVLTEMVSKLIQSQVIPNGADDPITEEILLAALETIYG